MDNIDYNKIFEVLDTFTGLPLKRKGNRWFGACYFDGSSHNRWDKLNCRLVDNGIQLFEQGNIGITLFNWLLQYGNCRTKKDAYEKLLAMSGVNIVIPPPKPPPPLKYVYKNVVDRELWHIGKVKDGLFLYFLKYADIFRVTRLFREMNVSPYEMHNGIIATVFWYVDEKGRFLYDKGVMYNSDTGKRTTYLRKDGREAGGFRRFQRDKGFYGEGYFGSHLLSRRAPGQKVYLCESEKSAILCKFMWPKHIFLATGGKNNLRSVEKDWIILADRDAWEFWNGLYPEQCHQWWLEFADSKWVCGEHDDIGDYVMYLLNKGSLNGRTIQ